MQCECVAFGVQDHRETADGRGERFKFHPHPLCAKLPDRFVDVLYLERDAAARIGAWRASSLHVGESERPTIEIVFNPLKLMRFASSHAKTEDLLIKPSCSCHICIGI